MDIPRQHLDILDKKALALVATIGADGFPQTTPVWFEWVGNALRFSTTRSRTKYRNLARDPKIAILIVDPDDPYRYIEMRGQAAVEDDPDGSLIDRLSRRYEDEDWDGPHGDRVIVSLQPVKVNTYG